MSEKQPKSHIEIYDMNDKLNKSVTFNGSQTTHETNLPLSKQNDKKITKTKFKLKKFKK